MGAVFKLDGSGKGAVKAVQDLNKALKETEKQTEATTKQQKMFDQQARRIRESIDPQEKYNRKVAETARLVKEGRLTTDQARQAVERYGRSLEHAGGSSQRAFGAKALSSVASYAAGLLSVGGAVSAIAHEFRALQALAQRASQTQVSAASSEAALRRNIFAFPEHQRQEMLAAGHRIASQQNLPLSSIQQALTGTVSATGDPSLTIGLTELASRFTRSPEEIPVLAAGMGDIIAGSNIGKPLDALGFLALTQGGARVTDPAKVAQNVSRVVSAFTAETAGGTAAEGGALFAALTKGGADPTGEVSRTAAIRLVEQTKKFLPRGGTVSERLRTLLGDRGLARQFLESTTFEAGAQGAISKLFLGDPVIRGAFDTTLGQLSSPDARVSAANRALDFVGRGPLQRTERVNAAFQSLAENIDLNAAGGLTGENVQRLAEIRGRASGFQTGQRSLLDLRRGANVTPVEAIEELEAARRDILQGQSVSAGVGGGGVDVGLSREQASTLKEISRTLDRMRELAEQQGRGARVRAE